MAEIASLELVQESVSTKTEQKILQESEKFGIDLTNMLHEILTTEPLHIEQIPTEKYTENHFNDDMSRIIQINLALKIAEEKAQAQLKFEKEQQKRQEVSNIDTTFENESQQLSQNHNKVEQQISNLMNTISNKYIEYTKKSLYN